jgi:hypothetical protein
MALYGPNMAPPSCDKTDRALFHASTMVTVGRGDKEFLAFSMARWSSTNGHCAQLIPPGMEKKNQKVKDDLLHMNWTRGL